MPTASPALALPGLASLRAGPPLLNGLAALLLLAVLPTLALGQLDARTVDGLPWAANVWAKPLKFQLAMGLHLLTLSWALGWMRRRGQAVPGRRTLVASLAVTVLFEAAYITLQGARGVRSHFNRSTPWEDLCATLMASGANVLVGACLWVGAVALWRWWRQPAAGRCALLLAIGLGFVAMFFLAGFTGAAMGQHKGPFVDLVAAQALPASQAGLPLTGWRLDIGDLRIAHFFGVHAMQALPLLAWLAERRHGPAQGSRAHAWVLVATLAWSAATLFLMQWAMLNRGLW